MHSSWIYTLDTKGSSTPLMNPVGVGSVQCAPGGSPNAPRSFSIAS